MTSPPPSARHDERAAPRACENIIAYLCLACAFGLLVCSCTTIHFLLDLDQPIIPQLTQAELIPTYTALALIIIYTTASQYQFHTYDKFRYREEILSYCSSFSQARGATLCPDCARAKGGDWFQTTSE